MRLVEIPSQIDDIENRNTLPQKVHRVTNALDLTHRAASHSCGAEEMTLLGSQGPRARRSVQRRINGGVAYEDAFRHQPLHECLGIIEARVFPRGAIQPERTSCGLW